MSFIEVIDQVVALLRHRGRLSYRVLKREFGLDDEQFEEVKEDLIEVQELAIDKDGKMLLWVGDGETTPQKTVAQTAGASAAELPSSAPTAQSEPDAPAGERRQLTAMFCDLVG